MTRTQFQATIQELIALRTATTRTLKSARQHSYSALTCRELRQLLKGTKGCTAAIRAGKAAMVAFAVAHSL